MANIGHGIAGTAKHDLWVLGDVEGYALGRIDRDVDGELVYTVYQMWISPKSRSLKMVRRLGRFFRFYAQKQQLKRFYVVTSRLDKIKAYARGLGDRFKAQSVIFVQEV